MRKELKNFIKKKVVLDTRSSWVYVGVLEKVTDQCVVLTDVDVHNNNDTSSTKELYIMRSKIADINENRKRVYVNFEYIVSFSLLKDIKQF